MDRVCPVTGKRCFSSKQDARNSMRHLRARLRVYLCEHCRLFHLTSEIGKPS
jgi:hypothetical protein